MKKIIVTTALALMVAGLLCIPLDLRVQTADAQTSGILVTTSTGTARAVKQNTGYGYESVHIEWTSTTGGAYTATLDNVHGEIARLSTAPVAAASPTANYDMVLSDLAGTDTLQGDGSNLSATLAADNVPTITEGTDELFLVAVSGRLTLSITNAGSAKQGEVTVIFKH